MQSAMRDACTNLKFLIFPFTTVSIYCISIKLGTIHFYTLFLYHKSQGTRVRDPHPLYHQWAHILIGNNVMITESDVIL